MKEQHGGNMGHAQSVLTYANVSSSFPPGVRTLKTSSAKLLLGFPWCLRALLHRVTLASPDS